MKEEFLSKSIDELKLSVRSFNCLNSLGIKTVEDLLCYTEEDLLSCRNFGRKCWVEINNILLIKGLTLGIDRSRLSDNSKVYPIFRNSSYLVKLSPEQKNELKDFLLEKLNLTVRASRVLNDRSIRNIYELLHADYYDILSSRNCGVKTAQEICSVLKKFLEEFILGKIKKICTFGELVKIVEDEILSKESLSSIFRNKNHIIIFKKRVVFHKCTDTLEKIGEDLSLTRERVRQIAKQTVKLLYKSLDTYLKEYLEEYSSRIGSQGNVVPFEEDHSIVNSEGFNVILHLVNIIDRRLIFDKKAKVWLRVDEKELKESLKVFLDREGCTSGDYYSREELIKMSRKYCTPQRYKWSKLHYKECHIQGIFNILTAYWFKTSGEGYFYLSLRIQTIFGQIIKEHFKDGFQISKDVGKMLSIIEASGYKEFLDKKNYKSNHSLITAIVKDKEVVLWGWGVYIHADNIKINKGLMVKIANWLDERFEVGINRVSIWGAFNDYKDECIDAGVPNEHALYSCMRMEFGKYYSFLKAPMVYPQKIKKRITRDKVLEKYLFDMKGAVDVNRVCKDLGLKDYQLQFILDLSNKILLWGGRTIIHVDRVKYNRDEIQPIMDSVKTRAKTEKYLSVKQVYNNNIITCKRNNIPSSRALYSILIKELSNKLFFPRYPHVLSKGHGIEDDGRFSLNDLLNDYFQNNNKIISYKEVYDHFVLKRGYRQATIEGICYYCDNIVRYTSESFVTLEYLEWVDQKNKDLLNIAIGIFKKNLSLFKKPFVSLDEMLDCKLPELGPEHRVVWQKTLLRELLDKIEDIVFLGVKKDVFIVNKISEDVEGLEDVIWIILKNQFNGGANIKDFQEYLSNANIVKRIDGVDFQKRNVRIQNEEVFIF